MDRYQGSVLIRRAKIIGLCKNAADSIKWSGSNSSNSSVAELVRCRVVISLSVTILVPPDPTLALHYTPSINAFSCLPSRHSSPPCPPTKKSGQIEHNTALISDEVMVRSFLISWNVICISKLSSLALVVSLSSWGRQLSHSIILCATLRIWLHWL